MAKADATKKPDPNLEPHAPGANADDVPVPAETAAREAAAAAAAAKGHHKKYTLIVRDVAGEMVLTFPSAVERDQARMNLTKRTPEGPIACSRGNYWPSANSGAVAGCIIPPDDAK